MADYSIYKIQFAFFHFHLLQIIFAVVAVNCATANGNNFYPQHHEKQMNVDYALVTWTMNHIRQGFLFCFWNASSFLFFVINVLELKTTHTSCAHLNANAIVFSFKSIAYARTHVHTNTQWILEHLYNPNIFSRSCSLSLFLPFYLSFASNAIFRVVVSVQRITSIKANIWNISKNKIKSNSARTTISFWNIIIWNTTLALDMLTADILYSFQCFKCKCSTVHTNDCYL